MTLNPKELIQQNAEEIKQYLQYSNKHMSLAKFQTQYLWRNFTGLTYDIRDDFLFLFKCKFENTAIIPYGNGDFEKAMNTVEDYYVGCAIADDMAVVLFEKADTEFEGIYAKLNQMYSSNAWSDIKCINRQEDMGKPGLRKSKRSYYPEFMVKNFAIRKM